MRELAARRGGECLSTESRGMQTKLRWRCQDDHDGTPSRTPSNTAPGAPRAGAFDDLAQKREVIVNIAPQL